MAIALERTGQPAPAEHFQAVVRGFQMGWVTPVLGAGASLSRRRVGDPDGPAPPSSTDLANELGEFFEYPKAEDETLDLLRVSQWAYTFSGSGPLYEVLRGVFDKDFTQTPLHEYLATVVSELRRRKMLRKPPVILTTNFDDLIEKALTAKGEQFDLVVYMADGDHAGRFCHRPPDGELTPIDDPRENRDVDPDKRTVVLKIHGFVNRAATDATRDSYVITEDHYIDYLTRIDIDDLIPAKVVGRLRKCHFLFLGYSLRDWSLRAILGRLYRERLQTWDWWAIQLKPDELEQRSWARREVHVYEHELDEYVELLRSYFDDAFARRDAKPAG